MSKPEKIMSGKDIFYTKLSIYLHLYKNKSPDNLAAMFGLARNTVKGWVKEFNRSRLESILKSYNMDVLPEIEDLDLEKFDRKEIRKILVRQAQTGNTQAAKMLLDMQEEEKPEGEEILTIEKALELLREWSGPSKCSKCGYEEPFKPKGEQDTAEYAGLIPPCN
jgi:predicted Zn-ribbon and HTH transcriptional regulator